jgi:hypothetical protein
MPVLARRMRLIRLFCTGCLFSILFLSFTVLSATSKSVHAQAFTNPITVLSETDTISFPNAITFQLKAQDTSSPITQAIISVTTNVEGSTSSTVENVPIAQAATTVSLHWQMATTGYNFLIPGSQVTYNWQLQDSSGTYTLPSQQFTTTDTRFSWQHLSQGMVQINWYNNSNAFGQGLLAQAVSDANRISHNLGGSPSHLLHIWVYQNDNDFHSALPPDTYEWVGGIAFPGLNECFIVVNDLNNNTVIRDMPHEMTHLIFHQLIAQGIEPPVWFDEGLAVYNQLYHEPAMTARLNEALTMHDLIPLNQLYFNFPADANQAYLAYAQSWNLVDYMYRTFGLRKMAALIRAIDNQNYDFSQDLQHTIGEDLDHLENQWHLYLHQPPTLSGSQQTSTSPQNTTPVQVHLNDSNQSFYLFFGLLLILIPLAGGIGLFLYIHRPPKAQIQVAGSPGYQVPPASLQAQTAPAPSATIYPYVTDWQHYTDSLPYINPTYYAAPLQETTSVSYVPPQVSTSTTWGAVYPSPAPAERAAPYPAPPTSDANPAYGESQEFVGKPPTRQAPQE